MSKWQRTPLLPRLEKSPWSAQGHGQEVKWQPSPEVLRGQDTAPETQGEREMDSPPVPQTRPGLQWAQRRGRPAGWKTPQLHLPSPQSSWQACPTGAAVRVEGPLRAGWEPGAGDPATPPGAQTGSLLPAPSSPPGRWQRRLRPRPQFFLGTGATARDNSGLPSGNPTGEGAVGWFASVLWPAAVSAIFKWLRSGRGCPAH